MTGTLLLRTLYAKIDNDGVDYSFEDYKPRLTMTESIIALKIISQDRDWRSTLLLWRL